MRLNCLLANFWLGSKLFFSFVQFIKQFHRVDQQKLSEAVVVCLIDKLYSTAIKENVVFYREFLNDLMYILLQLLFAVNEGWPKLSHTYFDIVGIVLHVVRMS